ncbi:MAG: radical SAM protein [Candidatus Omnitrophica bacterium]|nr:radical SAM protein [Candidatus Omnitrophota bacterium]
MENKQEEQIMEQGPYGFSKPWHKYFPPMIVVSITNACNLRCTHCYYSKFVKLPDYHKSMLPWELWEKICKEMGQWPGVIMNFGTDGEPLLHPRFLDMLRMARKYSIYPINVTTNGTIMDDKFNRIIVEENLVDIMNISVDAFTAERYRKIRGGSYEKVVSNVHNLISHRNKSASPIKIQINIIDQPEVKNELEDFLNYWKKYADNVLLRTYYDATSETGETGPNITGKQSKFKDIVRWPCQQLWRRFNISDDGTVRFCIDDWFNKTRIGHLKTQSIAKVWMSREYNQLRHLHITSQFDKIPYCAKCTEWQGMKWDYDYFTAIKRMLGKVFV